MEGYTRIYVVWIWCIYIYGRYMLIYIRLVPIDLFYDLSAQPMFILQTRSRYSMLSRMYR